MNRKDRIVIFMERREQAISAADGAITQLKQYGTDLGDEELAKRIAIYEQLKEKFCADARRQQGLDHKQELGHHYASRNRHCAGRKGAAVPGENSKRKCRRIRALSLRLWKRMQCMTISTGVQAVSECRYGRMDQCIWYANRIVQTFNRVLPGSISEMMPDYGDFTQAWTSYGIVVPLVEHVFGVQPDAFHKSIVFEPHLPTGWENLSIENLPVGTNVVSLVRTKTDRGVEYKVTSREPGWTMRLKILDVAGDRYTLNNKPIAFDPSGIQLKEQNNTLFISN